MLNNNYNTALVTGASSGIGEETVKLLVKNNIKVYAVARRKNKLIKLEKTTGCIPIVMDIRDRKALEKLKKQSMEVTIYSDSKYVIDSVQKKWVFNWEKKAFKDKKNPDLWKRYLNIHRKHQVNFQWIKGHNAHPQNERCDKLAVKAAKESPNKIDDFFEQNQK